MKDQNPPDPFPDLRRWAENRLKQKKREAVPPALQADNQRLVHELQVHQIELEMQNEELRQKQVEIEELLDRYTDLYDFAPVGYFTFSIEGLILQVNLAGSQLLGEKRGQLIKRRFVQFVCKTDHYKFNDFLQKVFINRTGTSEKVACEVTLDKKQDSQPSFESSGILQSAAANWFCVHIEARAISGGQECRAIIMDITKRQQAEKALQDTYAMLERNLKRSIDVISEMIEKKGSYTPGHHRRASALASAIAREMGLTDFQVQGTALAAAVYDIGLIDIPVEFLHDTNRLEGVKLTLYQGYAQAGHDALKKIEFPWPIADIILQHRECFDGSGFPRGIKGDAILIEAKILAVTDAIEDLTSNKISRQALSMEEALTVIENHRDSKYAPEVVAACMRLFKEKNYKLEG